MWSTKLRFVENALSKREKLSADNLTKRSLRRPFITEALYTRRLVDAERAGSAQCVECNDRGNA